MLGLHLPSFRIRRISEEIDADIPESGVSIQEWRGKLPDGTCLAGGTFYATAHDAIKSGMSPDRIFCAKTGTFELLH